MNYRTITTLTDDHAEVEVENHATLGLAIAFVNDEVASMAVAYVEVYETDENGDRMVGQFFA